VNFDLSPSEGRLMASSAAPTAPDEGELREQRRRKSMNSSEEAGLGSAKKQGWSKMLERAVTTRPSEIPTRNIFASLRAVEVDTGTAAADGPDSEPLTQQHPNPVPKRV
jgi:hypothetical protein